MKLMRFFNWLFGWKYVAFQFKCDGEVMVCRVIETASGMICRVGCHGCHGYHFLLPSGDVAGRYSGTWKPLIGTFTKDTP